MQLVTQMNTKKIKEKHLMTVFFLLFFCCVYEIFNSPVNIEIVVDFPAPLWPSKTVI